MENVYARVEVGDVVNEPDWFDIMDIVLVKYIVDFFEIGFLFIVFGATMKGGIDRGANVLC